MALAFHLEGPVNSKGSLKDITGLPASALWRSREYQRPRSKPSLAVLAWERCKSCQQQSWFTAGFAWVLSSPSPLDRKVPRFAYPIAHQPWHQAKHFTRSWGSLRLHSGSATFYIKSPVSWCCPSVLSRILFLMSSVISPSRCLLIFYF